MLNQQEALARSQSAEAMSAAKQMTPAEQALYEQSQAFLTWDKTAGKDIRDMPGIGAYLKIGEMAKRRAARERFGTGAMRLSGAGAEQYATKLRQQYAQESAQELGAGLETAYAQRRAEAMGSLLPLAQLGTQRNLGILNAAQQKESAYLNAPRETPFWKQLTLAAINSVNVTKQISDRRLKFSIKTTKYGLEEVLKLNPVSYIMDGHEQIGFIAQEVEEIMPEFVVILRDDVKGLMYGHMVAVMAKAIQELNAKVERRSKKGIVRKLLSSCISWLKSKV